MSNAHLNITDSQFKKRVLESEFPVLVDFWAGPCRMIAPIIDEIATEYGNTLRVAKMDIDQNPETAKTYGLRSIPTIMVFNNGELIETKIGSLSKTDIVKMFKDLI